MYVCARACVYVCACVCVCVCVCAPAPQFMRELCRDEYRPWDPYYGNPNDELFALNLVEYDEMLRKLSHKKQYHLLCNIQAELVEPYRCVRVHVRDCVCVCVCVCLSSRECMRLRY